LGLLKRAPLYPFVQLVLLQSTIGLPSSALLARVQGDQRQLQRPLPRNEKIGRRFCNPLLFAKCHAPHLF
jgi:hypothetical protein